MNKVSRKKQLLTIFLTLNLLVWSIHPAFGQEVTVETPTPTPVVVAAETPTPPAEPTAPPSPETPSLAELTPTPTPTEAVAPAEEQASVTTDPSPTAAVETDSPLGESNNGSTGEAIIETATATNSVVLTTVANDSLNSSSGDGSESVQVIDNGESATDSASVSVTDEKETVQENQAQIENSLTQTTLTGQNSTSDNVGSSSITTGDANTSGTVITAANSNVDGVMVAEFNVTDTREGDIVLDFDQNCISGCSVGESVENSGNGASSSNSVTVAQATSEENFQHNEALVESNLTLSSDTGGNEASRNTNGDSTIQTGDANTSASVLTFVNNNLVGNVVLGVVNIFGNLIGDIILPEEALTPNETVAEIDGGAVSQDQSNLSETNEAVSFQSNTAEIENNLNLSATTGDNEASRNTNGSSEVESGEASVTTQTVNVANNNVEGGSWWLVIVNKAGEWVGKILGTPSGTDFAGSGGTEFRVDEEGNINVINGENGASSENSNSLSQESSQTTQQTNDAKIVNNLTLSANTGQNKASDNTGGNSVIKTGDARVMASLINFVNNNFGSDSKVVITLVNVFGSWLGDFLPPGFHKDPPPPDDNNGENNGGDGSGSDNNEDSEPAVETDEDLTFLFQENQEVATPRVRSDRIAGITFSQTDDSNFPSAQAVGGEENFIPKQVRINLAWLTLTIPLFLLSLLLKKIIA